MNLLLVPMWMVSGSLFPMATAHGWIRAIMWINPLTYSISLLNATLRLPNTGPDAIMSLAVTAAFGLGLLLASGVMAAHRCVPHAVTRPVRAILLFISHPIANPRIQPGIGQIHK